MSRNMHMDNLGAATSDIVAPVLFADLDFSSGPVRVHSGIGTIIWGGFEWLGVGTLGEVSGIEESAELSARTITYTLRGIPNDLIAVVLGEDYQGRSARLYIGFFDTGTHQLIAPPELLDAGRMDVSDIDEGKECVVTITSESRMAAWRRPVVRRYTDAEQKARFPGDRGLEFISSAAQQEIVWGRKA